MSATEVAVFIWGDEHDHSRSLGARKVRARARALFHSRHVPHTPWSFNDAEVRLLIRELT